MEDDYMKSEKETPSSDTEKLLRIIQENPELLRMIQSTYLAPK